MRRMPSIVSTALGRHSSSPVVSVKVSASKISSSGSSPCSSQAMSTMRWAISTLRSRGLGHPDLVDGERDQRGAVRLRERDHAVGLVAAGLEVDRVDDPAAGDLLQRRLDHVGLGRVDLDRRRLAQRHALDHLPHLLVLVLALGERHAQVEHVRAAGHLVLGDLHEAVVVVGQQQLLRLARPLRVHALAHERGPRLLSQRRGGHHRRQQRRALGGTRLGRAPAHAIHDRRDVLGRGAAAAAHHRHAVALHELLEAWPRAAPASRGRSSRPRDPGAAARRSGCSAPAAGCARPGSGSRRACPPGRWSS